MFEFRYFWVYKFECKITITVSNSSPYFHTELSLAGDFSNWTSRRTNANNFELKRTAGVFVQTAWAGAAYYLLLYMLASHHLLHVTVARFLSRQSYSENETQIMSMGLEVGKGK